MFYYLTLLLPCLVCLVWAGLLFCKRKTNTRTQNILILYSLCACINFFVLATQVDGVTDFLTFYVLDRVDAFVVPLTFSFMYFYLRSLTYESTFGWRDYIWFLPAIVIGGGSFIIYQIVGKSGAIGYIESFLRSKSLVGEYSTPLYRLLYFFNVQLYDLFAIAASIGLTVYAVISLMRYHRRLRDFYSELSDKSMEQNRAVLVWFSLSILFIVVLCFTGRTFLERYSFVASLLFCGWALVHFGLCYHSSEMKYSVANLAQDLQQADNNECVAKVRDEAILIERDAKLSEILDKLIGEDKIFLRSNLRADEVARMMLTNRSYVSRIIKEKYGCSFSDFINRKRVEYAQELMLANPQMKQEEIANRSGFVNAPTLSRTFKAVTGYPPKEWFRRTINLR